MRTKQAVEFYPEIKTVNGDPIAHGKPVLVDAGLFVRVLLSRGDRLFVQCPDTAQVMAGTKPVFRWLHRTDLDRVEELSL